MAKKKSIKSIAVSKFRMGNPNHGDVEVVCRILIVCEGEKTEPNYFKSFERVSRGGIVYDITCDGGKINTIKVVDKAIELRDKEAQTTRPFDSVWAVFDKDSFSPANFNAAIQKASSNGINCAWSNEAFELWYIYHFENRVTAMSRKDFQKKISGHISRFEKSYKYVKNSTVMRSLLNRYGDESKAIAFAEKQAGMFDNNSYSTHNPSTQVYKLVRLLLGKDEEFNNRIRTDMGECEG